MKNILLVLSASAILFVVPNQAKADVVYNTFGPVDSYTTNTGWTIANFAAGSDYATGDAFTPTANYKLTSIQAALGILSGTNSVDLSLTNSIDDQPGSTIESFLITKLGPFGNNNPLITVDSVTDPELIAGDQYWLIATQGDPSTFAAWNWSTTVGPHVGSFDGGSTWTNETSDNQGAFRINGDPATNAVPEPPTVLLFAFAGGLVLFFNRNKILRSA